jgi:hypothetical protein
MKTIVSFSLGAGLLFLVALVPTVFSLPASFSWEDYLSFPKCTKETKAELAAEKVKISTFKTIHSTLKNEYLHGYLCIYIS